MSSDRPSWWEKNAELRDDMGLPEYEPSRLSDGTYIHEFVDEIEAEYGQKVQLVSENPSYPSSWIFRLGGSDCAEVSRRRNESGNNVYQITATELHRRIAETID